MAIKKKGTPEKIIEIIKEGKLTDSEKALLESIDFTPVKTGRLNGKKKKETK